MDWILCEKFGDVVTVSYGTREEISALYVKAMDNLSAKCFFGEIRISIAPIVEEIRRRVDIV